MLADNRLGVQKRQFVRPMAKNVYEIFSSNFRKCLRINGREFSGCEVKFSNKRVALTGFFTRNEQGGNTQTGEGQRAGFGDYYKKHGYRGNWNRDLDGACRIKQRSR